MSGEVATDLAAWLEESRAWAESALERQVEAADTVPAALHEAVRYALFGGGKRLRPALVRLVAHHLGGTDADAELPAAAVELVHTYSLVHDDLPCMDDDDLRRGRPTCHVVYGEAMGVLVGDALLTKAFELCAAAPSGRGAELAAVLARASGSVGMVGGQVLDLRSEGSDLAAVQRIHALKTAALFAASAAMGALAAGATTELVARAEAFGRALGLAFQATDDVLDVVGDAATLGKTPGKDEELERLTLVRVLGVDRARAEAGRLTEEAHRAAEAVPGRLGDRLGALVAYVLERRA